MSLSAASGSLPGPALHMPPKHRPRLPGKPAALPAHCFSDSIHGSACLGSRLGPKSKTINSMVSEPLAKLFPFRWPRRFSGAVRRLRSGPGRVSGWIPALRCGRMPQAEGPAAPCGHASPRRPLLRGGGGRFPAVRRRCQTVSRISRSTVRARMPKKRWQATFAGPLTRTCRPP